ncbi:MAG: ComEC/Rec2 family competence protein [Verrucomicrobiota bacterium]
MAERLRRALGRHPLTWAALLSAFAVLIADGEWLPGAAGLLGVVGLLVFSGKWRVLLGCLGISTVAGCLHFEDVERRSELRRVMGAGGSGPIEARLLEEPRASGRGWSGLAESVATGDRVWLRGRGVSFPRGSVVKAKGWYRPISAPRNPGEFDLRRWLDRRGAFAVFSADGDVELVGGPPARSVFGDHLRSGFREAVTRGLDPLSPEAAVIRAVVLGEHPDDDVLIEPFRRSGTLHVFPVSGLHVGMVGLIGWLVLRSAGVSRRSAVIPLMLMMFGYAWLTGMKPPAVRAAWMAAVVLGAFWFRRRPDVINALGLAALLVLLRDGDLVFQAGVQLSFGVVMTIGLLHRAVGRGFGWMRWVEPYLPRALYTRWQEWWLGLRKRVADMLTVSTSAWLGSSPLIALHFGLVTPISIVASVLLFPVVFLLLGLALLSAVLSPLPAVSEQINGVNAWLANSSLGIARTSASVPGGNGAVPRGRPAEEFLVVYDLEGDGGACWKGKSECLLIDGGSRRGFERVVMPSLREMALRPGRMVATHPDGGHVGGLVEAVDAFPIREAMLPVLRAKGRNFRDLMEACEGRQVRVIRGRMGQDYPLGEAAGLEVLREPDAWNWNDVADERVMPVRLEWYGWRILFMGDAGWATERAMMESGVDLQADVIVAGRHLHDASLGSQFLEATGARVIIASHADFPTVERVPETWRRACETRGIRVFHQGESGAVTVTADAGSMTLLGFVDGRELRLER